VPDPNNECVCIALHRTFPSQKEKRLAGLASMVSRSRMRSVFAALLRRFG
jgi:hypothetical protein